MVQSNSNSQNGSAQNGDLSRLKTASVPATTQNILPNLMHTMNSVKTNTPEARLNKASMADNNGSRIIFNEGLSRKFPR